MIIAKKKVIVGLYLIFISMLFISCKGQRELDSLLIVQSAGIDFYGEKILVTCEVLNPKSNKFTQSDSNLEDTILIHGIGDTVYEAIRNVTLYSDRKLFFSHNDILIIGEDTAKAGITNFMDIFLRDNEPRENMYLLIAKDSTAYEIMSAKDKLGQSLGEYLSNTLDNFRYSGKSIRITMAEYYRYYYDIGNEPVISVVKNNSEKNIYLQGTGSKDKAKSGMFDISGGSVLKEGRLIGYFSPEETLGFNFIANETKGGLIVFQAPKELIKNNNIARESGEFATLEILNSKTKNEIKIVDNKIHLTINVKLKGALAEVEEAIDIEDSKVLKKIEEACSNQVKNIISKTFDKGQKEFKQDNFNIGVLVHHKYPELWKEISGDWHSIFSDISYDVNVKTDIVKTGIISTPSNIRKGR